MEPKRPHPIVLAILAAAPLALIARGATALWSGEAWTASKSAPPTLLTGGPALAFGLFNLCLGLFVAAALAPTFGAPRRPAARVAIVASLAAVIFGAASLWP